VEKNMLSKIITIDNAFYHKRKKQLNYFINFLFKKEMIKQSKEFIKFTSDPEFDEEYFKNEDSIFIFPEANKFSETISNKIMNKFSSFTSSIFQKAKDEKYEPSVEEIKINSMNHYYSQLLSNYREIKNNISIFICDLEKMGKNYSEISNNFFYLKDVFYENSQTKDYFLNFSDLSNELGKINMRTYEIEGLTLEDRFEGFLSVMQGLCDIFERYTEFVHSYQIVLQAVQDAKINTRNYDHTQLSHDLKNAREWKKMFEDLIFKEVKEFSRKYNKEFSTMIAHYVNLVKLLSCEEDYQLEGFINILNQR
jgi:hypothetical protein